jgi:hypothetical protein
MSHRDFNSCILALICARSWLAPDNQFFPPPTVASTSLCAQGGMTKLFSRCARVSTSDGKELLAEADLTTYARTRFALLCKPIAMARQMTSEPKKREVPKKEDHKGGDHLHREIKREHESH